MRSWVIVFIEEASVYFAAGDESDNEANSHQG